MFLIGSLLFWIFLGWLADYAFPFGQAIDICVACFRGTLASKVNSLQQKFQNIDIVSQPDNQQQVKKLTNLEAQAWLYEGILERLGEARSTNHERIAKTLEALESKRNEILRELVPRRPKKYRVFAEIQKSARIFLDNQAEVDYERLDGIVTNLVAFTQKRRRSQRILSEVIERMVVLIAQNSNQISPYRLRLAYKVENLLRILSTKLILETDSTYQKHINELQSKINLLSQQFNSLLRSRQENSDKLNRSNQEISNLNRDISDLQKTIKRANVLDQISQSQINYLQNQLEQKKLELQQKLDIEQRYNQLLQQQENKVNSLREQRRQVKHLRPSKPTSKPSQQPVKETKPRISLEEYQEIINKDDYEFVKAYRRRDGTPVSGYYRKKRKKSSFKKRS